MPRTLVIHDGQLAEKIITESHQPIELGQLQEEVATRQSALDTLQSQVDNLTTQVAEAQAALADSKSDAERGQNLVEGGPDAGTEVTGEDGAGSSSTDSVAIPVEVL